MECFFKSGTVQNSAVLQGRPIYLTSKQDCACVHGEESFVCVCSQSWYVSLSLEKKVYPKISFVLFKTFFLQAFLLNFCVWKSFHVLALLFSQI